MDPYSILGVDKQATNDEIKSAYRKLSKDHHPDMNGGDDGKFKEISQAYKILTDPKEKAKFEEQKLRSQFNHAYQGSPDDFFKEFMSRAGFGGGFYTNVKMKRHGQDITLRATFSLEDAFHGRAIEISVDRMERLNMEKLVEKNRRIKINIPKGIKNGHTLILKGQGNHGYNGGRDGDINLIIEIKNHKLFNRREHDLFARVKIPFTQAMLGDSLTFKNIDNEDVDFTIPKNTQQGDKIEVLNKGMPVANSEVRGNLYLIVVVDLPKSLTERQIQILESLQSELGKKEKVEPINFESV